MIALRRRLERTIALLGFVIGLGVAFGVPLGYLLVAHSRLAHELSLVSELNAARVSKYIYGHRDLWEFHTMRLGEIIEVREAQDIVTRQRLYDSAGRQVLETGTEPAWPILTERALATVGGSGVATVETASSLRPILGVTAIIFVISALTGFAVVVLVRIVPLRILDRSLGELAATHARYRLLFEANPFPAAVVHRETKAFLAINTAAVEQYGWAEGEALNMTITAVRAPGGTSRPKGTNREPVFDSTTTYRRQHRQRKKDGSIIEVEVYSRAIEFDGQPAFLSLAVDVTDRNRFEEQLRQSQKMEAVGQLTGGIAHDFNNLMNVMVTHLEFLEEDEQLTSQQKARVGKVMGAVDRAASLTRQLLAFSRKQPLRADVISINRLIAGMTNLLGRTLGPRIEVETSLSSRLWPVEVDGAQLESALLNLCLNARDAMPGGGNLTIATRNVTLDAGFVARHVGATVGDYAMLSVTDSGGGMAADVLAQVFDPFFTTKPLGKGTGLGLSMVHGFINQSGGFVRASSEPGKGSIFEVYLPRTRKPLTTPDLALKPEVSGGDERVLVVEDQPELRAAVVEQLRSLGYVVEQAADGLEALEAFSSAVQPFDLLLTDVMMPGLNGSDLAKKVSARWPATKIIFMSGYTETEVLNDGIIDGNVTLLSKPIRKVQLSQAIRRVLGSETSPV